ncbi:MAG: ABC transporter ATP-binding protein [Alphaproteobacteria bacterium]|nr:ABC transporter ATP-binding protein [Alphaproteobacteria bacterium]
MTEAVVHARGLRRTFGARVALDALDLDVHAGRIHGLVGPDGAGKTTTLRLVADLLTPDAGEVRVDGRAPSDPAVREIVGLMPQRYSLYGDLSVRENLTFFRRLFGLGRREAEPRIQRLLDLTRLGPFQDRRADDLSGGMYKKLALACALLHQPRVLLLDEPTNGVDPVSRRELWTLLGEFAAQGVAVLVTTPYMDEAERCHGVSLLHEGKLVAEGAPAALVRALDHPVVRIDGMPPRAVVEALQGAAEVRALTPGGDRVRAVLAPGGLDALTRRLAPLGASVTPVRADFEDVFLARVREAEAA